VCRPPSARRGKLNAFATPPRRPASRFLSHPLARLRLAFSCSNRVTVKLITASFVEKTASPRNPRQTTKRSASKRRLEKRAQYVRGDVDCNRKIVINSERNSSVLCVPLPAWFSHSLLLDSPRTPSEHIHRSSPPPFHTFSYIYPRARRVDKRFYADLEIPKW